MARPKKQSDERRTERFNLRFTQAEKSFVETQATKAGIGTHEYLRRRSLGHRITLPPAKTDASLLMELNRIGVNLNQLTKQSNAGKVLPHSIHSTIEELQSVLEKVAAS